MDNSNTDVIVDAVAEKVKASNLPAYLAAGVGTTIGLAVGGFFGHRRGKKVGEEATKQILGAKIEAMELLIAQSNIGKPTKPGKPAEGVIVQ